MPKPNQIPKLKFEGVEKLDPAFQQWLSLVADTVNTHSGYNGEIQLVNHLDLQNNRIMNVGEPQESTDALPSGIASDLYSAKVLRPKLESNGPSPLQTVRRINDSNQREQSSSWLKDLMSTPATANNLAPTLTNGSGNVTVSIPSGQFTWADGSFVNTIGRTDVLSTPGQFAIISISCSGNVVTVHCDPTGYVAGEAATITSVTPSVFNGTFLLTSANSDGSILTYQLDLGTASGTGGFVQVNGVYYYSLKKRLQALTLHGPYSGDNAQNRMQACFDGGQIVIVVVITKNGAQIVESGGGGTPIVGASPAAGVFF